MRIGPGVAYANPTPIANCRGVSQPVSATVNRSTSGNAAPPPPNASAPTVRKRTTSSTISGTRLSLCGESTDHPRGSDNQHGVHEKPENGAYQQYRHASRVLRLAPGELPHRGGEQTDDAHLQPGQRSIDGRVVGQRE